MVTVARVRQGRDSIKFWAEEGNRRPGEVSYIRVICKRVQRELVEKLWVLDVLEVVFPESTV